ncbi:MAG TPA: G8 domain-containing protein, partial [Candidatus Obscuribacterales bacterium]
MPASSFNNSFDSEAILDLVNPAEATHIAVRNGSWFDARTWQSGQIPQGDAQVFIPADITVRYNQVSDTRLASVRVDGQLNFVNHRHTQMVVDTLVVAPAGRLTIGTEATPLRADRTARIIIADNGLIDTLWDPTQVSRGVLALGAVELHGAPKTAYGSAAIAPAAGDSTLVLDAAPTNWRVGDTLVIAGGETLAADGTPVEETVTIQAIAGNRVTLARPLAFDHADTTADPVITNLSRNIVITTENAGQVPTAQRGHVLLAGDDVAVRYVEFRELGRTDHSQPFDNLLLAAGDRTNLPGRYALQLSGVGDADANQAAIVEGNTIVGSPGGGYVQVNSHAEVTANAVYDVIGAGFTAATPQDSGIWQNNIALKTEAAYGTEAFAPETNFVTQGAIATDDNLDVAALATPVSASTLDASTLDASTWDASTLDASTLDAPTTTRLAAAEAGSADTLAFASAIATPTAALGSRTAEMWEFEEWDLSNATYSGNPFDLEASVTFTHVPTGEKRTTGMFYDGGNEWSFRFTGDLRGEWRFETDSSDRDLDGFTGIINVNPNDDPNIDGFMTSVGNKFAIQTDDANTLEGYLLNVYMNQAQHFEQGALDEWTRDRTAAYFADAQRNGSEVLYFHINNNWFDFGAETYTEHNSRNPDEQTFELLETIITDVHQWGGQVHFWAWGDEDRKWTPKDGINSEADQRLQSYIAARLGPLPGWSMGFGFDTQEFTDDSQIDFWANNLQSQMGWEHLLFARGYAASTNAPVRGASSGNDWVAEGLSGHSYSSKGTNQSGLQTSIVAPSNIEEVIADINSDRAHPHFYEERFTYNRNSVGSSVGAPNDMDKTRQLMWWQAMAGGVGGWNGFFSSAAGGAVGGSQHMPPYPRPDQLRTHYTFWHENSRFTLDLQQANNLADTGDTHLLKNTD